MRYFFHIVGGSELFPDELGRSLLTLESAKRHAKVLADELRKGGDFLDQVWCALLTSMAIQSSSA